MKEITEHFLKSKNRQPVLKLLLALITTGVLVGFLLQMVPVQAFDEYELTRKDNELLVKFTQSKASSTATYRYETHSWWLSSKELGGQDDLLDVSDYSGNHVTAVRTTVVPELTTEPGVGGLYTEVRKMDPEDIVAWAKNAYGREAIIEGEDGEPGKVTAYASRSISVLVRQSDGTYQPDGNVCYCYEDFVNALEDYGAKWSGKTRQAIKKDSYDQRIILRFWLTNVTVRVVDTTTGTEPVGFTNRYSTKTYIFGETLTETAPDITSYVYEGFALAGSDTTITGDASVKTVSKFLSSTEMGDGDITLTFYYTPEQSSDDDSPTQPPVTIGPTVAPTVGPTVPPAPPKIDKETDSEFRYFTTDQGHTLDAVAKNTGYYLAKYTGKDKSGTIASNAATQRTQSFLVGTDTAGNTWYFVADGTKAMYVHPAVYEGNDVNTAAVKNITELVFPSVITYNGTSYTVTTIGGGADLYHAVSSGTSGTTTQYDYGVDIGSYTYMQEYSTYGYYTQISYVYGVIGNGMIESYGEDTRESASGVSGHFNEFNNSYYVYNTTLKKVTIPDTVTQVCPYAFVYCEELEYITGGEGLIEIGASAFESATHRTAEKSREWTYTSTDGTDTGSVYYYYNGDCSTGTKTTVMTAWETEVSFAGKQKLSVSVFPVLITVGKRAFAYHTDLDFVVFTESTVSIGYNAFAGCLLESVTLPAASAMIAGGKDTLGTKGNVAEKTVIYTEPAAVDVIAYGRRFNAYYDLKCGYEITYHPNGATNQDGTVPATQKTISVMENLYLDIVDGGPVYSSYLDRERKEVSFYYMVEEDGSFWVKYGTTFTECTNVPLPQTILYNNNSCLVYSTADGTYHRMTYNTTSKALTVEALAFAQTPESVTISSCSTSYMSGSYVTADGSKYSFSVNSAGAITESVVNVVQKDLAREVYFGSVAGVTHGENINSNTVSPAGYDSSGNLYYRASDMAWRRVTGLPTATLTAYWYATYTDDSGTETGQYFAIDISGNAWTKSDSSTTWYKTTAAVTGDIVYAKVIGYDGSFMYSLIQNDSGTVWLYKTNVSTPGSTTSAGKSSVIRFGTMDGVISETYAAEIENYVTYNLIFYALTDSGALYCFTDCYKHNTYLPSAVTRMAGDNITFAEIYFENVGNFTDEMVYYNYNTGNLAILGLTADGSIWATGHDNSGYLGGGGAYYPEDDSYLELNDISNGVIYTDMEVGVTEEVSYDDSGAFVSGTRTWYVTYAISADGDLYGTGDVGKSDIYTSNFNARSLTLLMESDAIRMCSDDFSVTKRGYLTYTTGGVTEYIHDNGYRFVGKVISNTFFIRRGYDFVTWNTVTDGTGITYAPGTEFVMTDDLTLYAQWKVSLPTIHYDPNADDARYSMADTVLPVGTSEAYLSRNLFRRDYYRFTGWNTKKDGSGTSYADGAYITGVSGYLVLYAQWEEVVINYTIVYMMYPYGTAGNTPWTSVDMITSISNTTSETVKGEPFTPPGCTVAYDLNRGSSMSTVPVMGTALTDDYTKTDPPAFDKWQYRELYAGGNYRYYRESYETGDVVTRMTDIDGAILYFYPVWGGNGSYVLLPDASCEGYILAGWCESADGSTELYLPSDVDGDVISTYTPVRDTTLYAIWEARQADTVAGFKITGTSDKDAEQLLQDGIQAITIKKGHVFSYKFWFEGGDMIEKVSKIRITPNYFLVSEDESEREETNVYYHAFINGKREYFLLAGSERDTRNGQENGCVLLDKPVMENETKSWEAEFSLPSVFFVVCADNMEIFREYQMEYPLTGNEVFFEKNGNLVVCFAIEMQVQEEWITYEDWQQTDLYEDAVAAGWNCEPGDVIRYDLESSIAEDYEIGGVE